MKKYRNFVMLEQIKECIRSGRQDEALEIAEGLDIHLVKGNSDVNLMADLYIENGLYEKGFECLREIYNRKKTRSVLMQLINLSVRMKNINAAEKYFADFREISGDDFYNHIFRYNIDKIEGKPIETLIESLEQLKEKEYIEIWAYELAKLYHKSGMSDKCVRECNDIEVWFGEGPYVERAKALRAYYKGELDLNKPYLRNDTAAEQNSTKVESSGSGTVSDYEASNYEAVPDSETNSGSENVTGTGDMDMAASGTMPDSEEMTDAVREIVSAVEAETEEQSGSGTGSETVAETKTETAREPKAFFKLRNKAESGKKAKADSEQGNRTEIEAKTESEPADVTDADTVQNAKSASETDQSAETAQKAVSVTEAVTESVSGNTGRYEPVRSIEKTGEVAISAAVTDAASETEATAASANEATAAYVTEATAVSANEATAISAAEASAVSVTETEKKSDMNSAVSTANSEDDFAEDLKEYDEETTVESVGINIKSDFVEGDEAWINSFLEEEESELAQLIRIECENERKAEQKRAREREEKRESRLNRSESRISASNGTDSKETGKNEPDKAAQDTKKSDQKELNQTATELRESDKKESNQTEPESKEQGRNDSNQVTPDSKGFNQPESDSKNSDKKELNQTISDTKEPDQAILATKEPDAEESVRKESSTEEQVTKEQSTEARNTEEQNTEATEETSAPKKKEPPETVDFDFGSRQVREIDAESLLGKFLSKREENFEDYFEFYAFQSDIRNQLIKTIEILLNPQIKNICMIVTGSNEAEKNVIIRGIARMLFNSGFLVHKQIFKAEAQKLSPSDLSRKIDSLIGSCFVIRSAGKLTKETVKALLEINEKLTGRTAVVLTDERSGISSLLKENRDLNSMFPQRLHISDFSEKDLEDMAFYKLRESDFLLEKEALPELRKLIRSFIRTQSDPVGKLAALIRNAIDRVETRNANIFLSNSSEGRFVEENVVLLSDLKALSAESAE